MRRRSDNNLKKQLLAGAALMLAPFLLLGQANKPEAASQPQAGSQDSGAAVFSTETRLVPLNVTVVDKSGHRITNLPQTAFTVFENGAPQQIKIFRREDVPVSLGLIIDNSGSMREKRQGVEAAALALVKDSNPQDEVFVVNFNDEAYLDTCQGGSSNCFTNDTRVMEQALTRIDSRGGTAMRDAIRMSIDELKKGKRDKKVLLVVTDGNDNASLISLENLVRSAQQNDILVYAIGLLSEEDRKEAKKAKRALDLLVESTGGQAFYPKDVSEVDKIAHEVAHDIRNQYTIAYTPSNGALDGTYRTIKVIVKGPGNPTARTRSGYYATPDARTVSGKSHS
jgi:Ca-activated chloride channel homolog